MRNQLNKIETDEFNQLVKEVDAQGFTESRQVSMYIVKNKLGYKYKNISGILEMENHGDTWSFKGGFPPKIYAMLCDELEFIKSGNSDATPGKFTPFKDINEEHYR